MGPAGEFDLGDEFAFQPMHIARLARSVLAAERTLIGSRFLQRRHDTLDRVLPKAGADDPDIGEMIAAIDAGQQRAELAFGGLPSPHPDLIPAPGFALGPASGPA